MIQVSGFTQLPVPSPSQYEPTHYLTARQLEADLNTDRQSTERFRQSVEADSPVNQFLRQLGRTNVVA